MGTYLQEYTTFQVYKSDGRCTITTSEKHTSPQVLSFIKNNYNLSFYYNLREYERTKTNTDIFTQLYFKKNLDPPYELKDVVFIPTELQIESYIRMSVYKTEYQHTIPLYIYRLKNKNIMLEFEEKLTDDRDLIRKVYVVRDIYSDYQFILKYAAKILYRNDILKKEIYLKKHPKHHMVAIDFADKYIIPDYGLPTAIIFILCYNNETEKISREKYSKYQWAQILRIQTTKYLENIMYYEWLESNQEKWKDYDYVGTLSWRAYQKINIPNITNARFFCKIRDIDVVVFFPLNVNMLESANRCHPLFSKIWNKLLTKMGFSHEDINNPTIFFFSCNYWMAKPEWMRRYMDFFKKAMNIIENDSELQEDLYQDSTYGNGTIPVEKLMELWGKPYYTYHAFIYERLSCFFFWKEGAVLYGFGEDALIV